MLTDPRHASAHSLPLDRGRIVSLGDARPGTRYRVIWIMFSLVRERLEGLGIREGDVITCTGIGLHSVQFSMDGGQEQGLGDGYGWFVQVQPLGVRNE